MKNLNPGKILADFEKAALKAFSKKNPPRRNLVLLFPPDTIFQLKNQWDQTENLLRKFPQIQLGTSNVTSSGTCSARLYKGIFWASYWENTSYREGTVRRRFRWKNGLTCIIFEKYLFRKPNCRLFQSKCGTSTMQQERG